MGAAGAMARGLEEGARGLREGLDPDVLEAWYARIVADAVEMAPPWLQGRIAVRRDPVITLRFTLDMSRRAVRYFMMAAEARLGEMPYSTRLYFLKALEELDAEASRDLA